MPNALATGENLKIEGETFGFRAEAGTIRTDTVQRDLSAPIEQGSQNLTKFNFRREIWTRKSWIVKSQLPISFSD